MGLRERKKARTRAAILETAAELSRGSGFDGLRVRDLIERLEISEATFFNYFPSKAGLLDAWLEAELANAFAELVEVPTRNRRSALRSRVRRLARAAATAEGLAAAAWERACVQRAAAAAARRGDVVALLEGAREAGEIRRDIEPGELAELLVGSVVLSIAAARQGGAAEAEARAQRAADLVLDGARRRHERVRLATGGTPPRASAPR